MRVTAAKTRMTMKEVMMMVLFILAMGSYGELYCYHKYSMSSAVGKSSINFNSPLYAVTDSSNTLQKASASSMGSGVRQFWNTKICLNIQ